MTRLYVTALLLGAFAGCYTNLESFHARMAKLGCINARECKRAQFDAEFTSLADCKEQVTADLDGLFGGCSYDAKAGRACVHATYARRKDCGLFEWAPMSECMGAVVCQQFAEDDGSFVRVIVHSFTVRGSSATGIPLDAAVELDDLTDEESEALLVD